MGVFLADPVFWGYFIAVVLTWIAGFVVSIGSSSTWYRNLPKSNLNPPNWIFFPVWTILYILFLIAGYVGDISAKNDETRTAIRVLFGINLLLTVLWSMFFFGWHEIEMAGVINLLLIGTIIALMILFIRDKSWAVYVLIPYLAWTLFAFYLTVAILRKNRRIGYYDGGVFSGHGPHFLEGQDRSKDIINEVLESRKRMNSPEKGVMDRLEPIRNSLKSVENLPSKVGSSMKEEFNDLLF